MKKRYYLGILPVALLMAGCSNEMTEPTPGSGGNVTFNVKMPAGMATRAFADGTSATALTYAVYESGTTDPIITSTREVTFSGLQASLTLDLVNGKSYDVIFWADSPQSGYTFDFDAQTVAMNYEGIATNSETRDAFFNSVSFTVTGPTSQDVELTRPFAQVNLGTSDLALESVEAAYPDFKTSLTTQTYTGMNLMTGVVTGDLEDVTFTAAAPAAGETFPYQPTTYDYVSMNYILVGDKEAIDCTYSLLNGDDEISSLPVPAVPMQRNYRTNIYGSLLTSPSTMKISVNPAFETPDYIYEVWDGVTATQPTQTAPNEFTVETPSQMAGVMQNVNNGTTYAGQTITLSSTLDMGGNTWTPVGSSTTNAFKGTFDGAGHEIKGLENSLFGYVSDATIKDVTLTTENAEYAGLARQSDNATLISGVTVNGSVAKSSDNNKWGAAGFVSLVASGSLTLEGCTNNATVTDDEYVAGGFVGRTKAPVTLTNCQNTGAIVSNRPNGGKAAGLIALPAEAVTVTNCTNSGAITVNTTITGAAAGMIAWWNGAINCSGSSNTGNITLNIDQQNSWTMAGGIYGGNGWGGGTQTFTRCSNSGTVKITATNPTTTVSESTPLYAGGIVGATPRYILSITGCTNTGLIQASSTLATQIQALGAMIGGFGWMQAVTITGNTYNGLDGLTGNGAVSKGIAGYFMNTFAGNTDPTVSGMNAANLHYNISDNTNSAE